jgi:hypothetical protein
LDRAEQQYRINSLAGGIAVLVIKHRSWLSEHPEIEDWCFEVAQTLTAVVDGERDSPDVVAREQRRSVFSVNLALRSWTNAKTVGVSARGYGVTGFFYSSTWQTMWLACDRRASLGHRFDELIQRAGVLVCSPTGRDARIPASR